MTTMKITYRDVANLQTRQKVCKQITNYCRADFGIIIIMYIVEGYAPHGRWLLQCGCKWQRSFVSPQDLKRIFNKQSDASRGAVWIYDIQLSED